MRYAAAWLAVVLAARYSAAETPPWQEFAQSANEAQSEGRWAAAEQSMQNAWTAIQRAGAGEADFPVGVQMVVSFYNSEGLGLKADAILREAETAVERLPAQHPNRPAILILKAQTFESQGHLVEAQAVYEQLLTIQTKTYGSDSMEVHDTLQTLANSYDRSGELEKAEVLFDRLDSFTPRPSNHNQLRLEVYDGPSRFCCESASLADFYDRHGRFADAEKAYLATIARAEREDAEKHELEPALSAYQIYLQNHRRFREAQQIQARIMEQHRNNGNPPDLDLDLSDRMGQASLYEQAEQFEEAGKVYEKARSDFLATAGPDSSQYRNLLQNYVSSLIWQGKLDQAEELAHELDRHATSDPDDYTHDGVLNLMAQIREKAGDQKGAEAYREELNAIQNSRAGASDSTGINEDIASAQALLSQGNVDAAWSRIDRALTQIDSEALANVGLLNQIAGLTGSFPEKSIDLAEQLIERVQAIQDRRLPPTHPLYNPWLFVNYVPLAAERFWSKHILALESVDGPDSPRLVGPLNQLANLLQPEHLEDAVRVARRALNILEKTSGPNSDMVRPALARLGPMYFNLGELTSATETYERLIRLSSRIFGKTATHAHILANAAGIYGQWQQFDRALELAREALDISSQPEYASETEFFRGVLETLEKQKTAAAEAHSAIHSR